MGSYCSCFDDDDEPSYEQVPSTGNTPEQDTVITQEVRDARRQQLLAAAMKRQASEKVKIKNLDKIRKRGNYAGNYQSGSGLKWSVG